MWLTWKQGSISRNLIGKYWNYMYMCYFFYLEGVFSRNKRCMDAATYLTFYHPEEGLCT